jgi:hypothetical protein
LAVNISAARPPIKELEDALFICLITNVLLLTTCTYGGGKGAKKFGKTLISTSDVAPE